MTRFLGGLLTAAMAGALLMQTAQAGDSIKGQGGGYADKGAGRFQGRDSQA